MSAPMYNQRSPAVKRLMREAQELREATEEYFAQPLEDNLFEWHFTVRGPPDSDFEGGVYHGRIILPTEYPMKPPNIIILTPNGRFETNKKICLSISGHHPESWQPSWSLRTAMLALIGFMPSQGAGAIGSLECSSEERKKLAKKSASFECSHCGPVRSLLKEASEQSKEKGTMSRNNQEAMELASQIDFMAKAETKDSPAPQVAIQIKSTDANPNPSTGAPETTSSAVGAPTDLRLRASPPPLKLSAHLDISHHPEASNSTSAAENPAPSPAAERPLTESGPTVPLHLAGSNSTDRVAQSEYRPLLNMAILVCTLAIVTLYIRRVCFL